MKNLDDFIKNKLEQDPIVFSEAHWMKAAQLIEAQEIKRRKRFVWWSFIGQSVLLAILLLIGFVKYASIDTPVVNTQKKTQPQQAFNEDLPFVIEGLEIKNTTPKSESSQKPNQINGESKASEWLFEKTEKSIKNTRTGSQKKTLYHKTTSKDAIIAPQNDQTLRVNEMELNQGGKIPIPIVLNDANITTKNNKTTTEDKKEGVAEIPVYAQKTNYLSSKIQPIVYASKPKMDAQTQWIQAPNTPRAVFGLCAASSLYPYAQLNAKRLIAYSFGGYYSQKIKPSWRLEMAINYRVREGSFGISKTTTQDSFAFRRIATEHQLKASSLHTVEVPLSIVYQRERQQLKLGVNYARLIGVKGSLSKTLIQDNPEAVVLEKGWLEEDSFSADRLEVILGYYYQIRSGLSLGVDVHYMVNPLVKSQDTADLLLESKPLFLDFGIRYDLLK